MNGPTNVTLLGWVLAGLLCCGCQRPPQSALDRAHDSYRSGNWNATITACNEILDHDTKNAQALQLRGRAYLAMREYDRSVKDFSKLVEIAPTNHETFYYRSMAFEGLGDQARADEDRAHGRQLDPARKSSYAYSPSNFVPKTAFEVTLTPDATTSKSKQRDLLAEESPLVVSEGQGIDAAMMLPPRTDKTGGEAVHDEEFVRDAVDDFRRLMSETESLKDTQRPEPDRKKKALASPKLPQLKPDRDANDRDNLEAPGGKDTAAQKDKPPQSEEPSASPARPALSTALPPGFQPLAGISQGQLPYPLTGPQVPVTSAQPSSAPAAVYPSVVPYGIPGVSWPGTTVIQPNTIHAPGAKPMLSTSLPTGPLQGRVPGAPSTSGTRELPPMLPQPVKRYDVP